MIGHPFTSPQPPPDANYQSWLRRRIATLKEQQSRRIELHAAQKKAMDATEERAAREIANLETQLTIGVAQ